MELSIIIPAYNEHKKIRQDIVGAAAFLEHQHISGEIIIVDDGSTDYTAESAILTQINPDIKKEIIHYTPNRGKGYAVRSGMAASHGEYIMFIDSGSTIPWDHVHRGLDLLRRNRCDIANASRRLPESRIVRPHLKSRQVTSLLFRRVARLLLSIPDRITDSQCGLKMYKGKVGRSLYAHCITDGFLFDIEILLKALKSGHRILEFPIDWYADVDSRLSPSRTLLNTLLEMWEIHKELQNYVPAARESQNSNMVLPGEHEKL